MMFRLSKEQYELLTSMDFSELGSFVRFYDDLCQVAVEKNKIRLFKVIISEEIDRKGFTNHQEEVTPYGRRLYDLYDTIHSQI